jgi:hypothetical protein
VKSLAAAYSFSSTLLFYYHYFGEYKDTDDCGMPRQLFGVREKIRDVINWRRNCWFNRWQGRHNLPISHINEFFL